MNIRRSRFIVIFPQVLMLSLLVSCSTDQNYSDKELNTFGRLANADKQEAFLSELKDAGIYYQIDERGNIMYRVVDTASFLSLKRKLSYGDQLDSTREEYILVSSDKKRVRYIDAIRSANIPVRVKSIGSHKGAHIISYSQKYGPKVDEIVQMVDLEWIKTNGATH